MDEDAAESLARLQHKEPVEGAPSPTAPLRAAPAPARPVRRGRAAMWGLGMMTGVLLAIGLWAAGAEIYMWRVVPRVSDTDVAYPLLHWDWLHYGYSTESRWLAGAMMLCWPVAAILGAAMMFLFRAGPRK